jgi:superfamily II DNA or RNA helicase
MRLLFDRGTLLLENAAPPERFSDLPSVFWDPRIGQPRAPAFAYEALLSALLERGQAITNDAAPPALRDSRWRAVELRPYQHAALVAWGRERERGIVVLPTGSGKTRVACAAMAASATPTLCLVPTRALLHQWRAEIGRSYDGPIGCLGDGEHELQDVTVSTFESAYRQMSAIGDRFGLLVVDEVHHFGDGVRDEALEMSTAPRRLGLTATVPGQPALGRVADLVGPVVCELKVSDLAGLWLADFDSIVLRLRMTGEERSRYDANVAVFREVYRRFLALVPGGTWKDFMTMASRSPNGREAVCAFRDARRLTSFTEAKRAAVAELLRRHKDNRVLVFTQDNGAAYAIAREHFIMPITCDIGRKEREEALAAFRAGELSALVSSRVLNEGIDVPDAEVAIVVGGVAGEREHVQRVGRLLRPRPGKRAVVYELVMMATHETRQSRERRRGLAPAQRAAV